MGKVNSMIEQNGVVYYLEEALNKQKDGFDNQLTLSGDNGCCNFIRGYFGEVRELDLSWISLQDIIDLKGNPGLGKIYMNCSNTRNASLKTFNKVVCDINVDCNVVVAGAALKRFLENNIETIGTINFYNVSNHIVKTYLEDMCNKYGVLVEFADYDVQLNADDLVSGIAI